VRHAPPGWSDGQWRAVADRLNLSDRELEIVRGVLDDRKQSSIAAQLGISSHTVHTYLVRLYLKLRVSSRMELAMRVIGQFQTEPPPTASEPAPSFHSDAGEASRRERGNTPPT
jgi:DNA-binding CsgD family transcriptional regulator